MTGTWRTLVITLRTSWALIVVPPVLWTLLAWLMAGSISRTYDNQEAIATYESFVGPAPATKLLQGRGHGLDTAGGIFAQQMAVIVLTLFLLYAAWLGVRLTRTMEDKGYFDVISSGTVGRLAPTGAGLAASFMSSALTGVGMTVAGSVHGFEFQSSALYGLIVALSMATAATLGTVSAQLFRNATEALYLSSSIVVALYLLRGHADYYSWNAVWANPSSWVTEAAPYSSTPAMWPYIGFLVLTTALASLTLAFAGMRDLGGGIFAAREGRATARQTLRSSTALLLRLTWKTTAVITIIGGMVCLVLSAFNDQPVASGSSTAQAEFLSQLSAEIASITAMSVVGVLSKEEKQGRTGRVLASPLSRGRWYSAGLTISVASSLVVVLVLGAVSGIGTWSATSDPDSFTPALTGALTYFPAVALCSTFALLLSAIRPGLNNSVWAIVGWSIVVSLPSNILDLSETARRISPFELLSDPTLLSWSNGLELIMGAAAIVLTLTGRLAFAQRDLVAG